MPIGITNDALILGLVAITNRTIQVRLHYDDPGTNGTDNEIARENGYARLMIARAGFSRESTSDIRYSNTQQISFGPATGDWGDGTDNQTVSWLTLWYDRNDPTNTDDATFDTLLSTHEFHTSQQVTTGNPFVIQAHGIDLVSEPQ